MTELSNLPIKVLVNLSKLCYENQFGFENPYLDYKKNFKILKSFAKFMGVDVNDTFDVEFMAMFLLTNLYTLSKWFDGDEKFDEIKNELQIPELKKFKIEYEVWGNAVLTEYYDEIWSCYKKEWVRDSIEESENDGSWSYYDGNHLRNETENFEVNKMEITNISNYQKNQNETIFSKLVVENTESIVENLDRETLIKLKSIIERKLNS